MKFKPAIPYPLLIEVKPNFRAPLMKELFRIFPKLKDAVNKGSKYKEQVNVLSPKISAIIGGEIWQTRFGRKAHVEYNPKGHAKVAPIPFIEIELLGGINRKPSLRIFLDKANLPTQMQSIRDKEGTVPLWLGPVIQKVWGRELSQSISTISHSIKNLKQTIKKE